MLQHHTGGPGTAISRTMSEIESNLGTMVINNSEHSTMKQYGTAPGTMIIECFINFEVNLNKP